MRSQIKMEMTRYPVFDVISVHDFPQEQQMVRKCAVASQESSRNKQKIKNMFNTKKDGKGSFIDYDSSEIYRLSTKSKKNVNKFVSELTSQIQHPREKKDLTQSKFRMLKRIIEHYDIKNLKKNDYSKLIKTFGLNIETARTEKKSQTKEKIKKFNIKSSNSSRFSILKQNTENDNSMIMLHLSQEVRASSKKPKMPSKIINKQKLISMQKQRNKEPQKMNRISIQKMPPFHYQSKQDIIVGKVNKYREFIFALNLSNRLYRDLQIRIYSKPLKYYVGSGNNSNLIKSLMKKRFWYQETSKLKNANFVWTQIKVESIYVNQETCQFEENKQEEKVKTKNMMIKVPSSLTSVEQNMERVLSFSDFKNYQKINELALRKVNIEFSEKCKYSLKNLKSLPIAQTDRVHNHISSNGLLGNKKGMFYSLRQYYKLKHQNVFEIVPITFHISKGIFDEQYKKFIAFYEDRKKKKLSNCWIMKPGEFSNRGQGITCSKNLDDIKKRIMTCKNGNQKKGEKRTLILQLYITNPLLYNHRKFDIRVFMLITVHNGKIKAYWYQEGYIRTSSYTFDLSEITDTDIHLTNDAIQKESGRYGKYEPANKLSFHEFQRYLDTSHTVGKNLDLQAHLLPRMKQIASQAVKSSFLFLDRSKKLHNFELFGLDFMVDNQFKPWLIEINTNPCLELSCPLLHRIIPHMLENALRIGLDPIFPPADNVPHNYKYTIAENAAIYNKFQLIFDEERDGPSVKELFNKSKESESLMVSMMGIQEDQQQYEEEGDLGDYDV